MTEDEITLTKILELTKDVINQMQNFFSNANKRIEDVNGLVSDIDNLILSEKSQANKTELLQYKSYLLQIKSGIESEIENMKKEQINVNTVFNTVGKAIKWNSGDIF